MPRIHVWLSDEAIERLDEARGRESRSSFIRRAVEEPSDLPPVPSTKPVSPERAIAPPKFNRVTSLRR